MWRAILLTLVAFCLPKPASCQQARPELPPIFPNGVRTIMDIPYRSIDGKALTLDLYLPAPQTGSRPAVVFVHGGGFVSGHSRMMGAATDFPLRLANLAAGGYVVASIEYRLVPGAHFPAQVRDAKAAIGWLRDHAAAYGIDPDRIAIWGSSAGGTIAATVGTTCGVAMFEPEGTVRANAATCVQAVADWFGPVPVDNPLLAPGYLGCRPGSDCRERQRAADPTTYIEKGNPPFFVLHGDGDKLVAPDQSRRFAAALRSAGVNTSLLIVPGAEHGLRAADPANQQAILDHAMEALKTFLDRTIGQSSRRR